MLTQAARFERNEARRGYRSGHYKKKSRNPSKISCLVMPLVGSQYNF